MSLLIPVDEGRKGVGEFIIAAVRTCLSHGSRVDLWRSFVTPNSTPYVYTSMTLKTQFT